MRNSDQMGRFSFDGAEGIAFWVNDEDEEIATPVMFDDLPTLKAFLQYNLPGMFEKTQEMEYRAERAEYIISRVEEELEGLMDSLDDHVGQDEFHEALRQAWGMIGTPFDGHIKGDHDGIEVCLTCPKNSNGYHVGWEHLHSN